MPRKGGTPENLIPPVMGERRNPKGRPKLPDIKAILEEVLGEQKDGITAAEALMKKLRQMGAAGNIKAIEMLLDRAYGKPKQTIDTTTEITVKGDPFKSIRENYSINEPNT